ncbi:MAG: hypothetical protein CMM02_08360 [Rhodopirellula sp.]|nr:hypothetical protein [Rhodopirellula sp.]|tara:strand:+ start:21692 stop:31402 length:9711 start_codon:yes stop_codon:yes gene_type:complete
MPNLFVENYRKANPATQLSDDQITIQFAENHASELDDLYTLDPLFKEDLGRIFGSPVGDRPEYTGEVTAFDRAKQGLGKFVEGFTGQAVGIPESIAIGTAALNRATFDDDEGRFYGDTPFDPKETVSGKLADFIKDDLTPALTPDVSGAKQDEMRGDFWTETVPSGLGSGLGFIIGGLGVKNLLEKSIRVGADKLAKETGEKALKAALEKGMSEAAAKKFASEFTEKAVKDIITPAAQAGLRRKTNWGIAGLGAAVQGPAGYQDAINNGATPNQAFTSFLLNAGVGTSEIFPLQKFVGRIGGMGGVGEGIRRKLVDAIWEGGEEALQELFQGASGDVIAKWIIDYDPDREVLGEWKTDAAAGGVTGFIMSIASSAIGAKVRGMQLAKSGVSEEASKKLAAKIAADEPLTEEEQELARSEGLKVDDRGVVILPKTDYDPDSVAETSYEGPKSAAIVALAEREAKEGFTREIQEEYNKLLGVPGSEDAMEKRLYDKIKFQTASKEGAAREEAETAANIDEIIAKVEEGGELTDEEAAVLRAEAEKKGGDLSAAEKVDLLRDAAINGHMGEGPKREEELRRAEEEADRQIKTQLDFARSTGQIPPPGAAMKARVKKEQDAKDALDRDEKAEAFMAKVKARDAAARIAEEDKAAGQEGKIAKARQKLLNDRQKLKVTREAAQQKEEKKRIDKEKAAQKKEDDFVDETNDAIANITKEASLTTNKRAVIDKLIRRVERAAITFGSLDNAEAKIPGIKELDARLKNYKEAPKAGKDAAFQSIFEDQVSDQSIITQGQVDAEMQSLDARANEIDDFMLTPEADNLPQDKIVELLSERNAAQQRLRALKKTRIEQINSPVRRDLFENKIAAEIAVENDNNPETRENWKAAREALNPGVTAASRVSRDDTETTPTVSTGDLLAKNDRGLLFPKDAYGNPDESYSPVYKVVINGQDRYITSLQDDSVGSVWFEYIDNNTSPSLFSPKSRTGKDNPRDTQNYVPFSYSKKQLIKDLAESTSPTAATAVGTSLSEKTKAIDLDKAGSNNKAAFQKSNQKLKDEAQRAVESSPATASNRMDKIRDDVDLNGSDVDPEGYWELDSGTAKAEQTNKEIDNLNTLLNSKAITVEQLTENGITPDGDVSFTTQDVKGETKYNIFVDGKHRGEGKTPSEAVANAAKSQANRIGQLVNMGGTVPEGGRNTRRIAVLESPNKEIVAVSVHETKDGNVMVSNIKGTKAASIPISSLLVDNGYKVVGSIKTKNTAQGFKQIYESKEQYDTAISKDLIDSASRASSLAEGVAEDADPNNAAQLNEGVDQPIGDAQAKAKTGKKFAPRRDGFPRPSETKVNTAFASIVDAARTAGVEVRLLEKEMADVEKKAAAYMTLEDGRVVAVLAMNSIHNPSNSNTIDLLHEIGHVAFDQLDPAIIEALGTAISKASDKALGIEGSAFMYDSSLEGQVPNELTQEERLVESVAREMAEDGFNPDDAKGLVGSIVRIWKNVSFAARMAFQRLILGKDALSPALAKEHFRLHVEGFLTGNRVPSFLNYLVQKPTLFEAVQAFTSDVSSVFMSNNGFVEVEPVTPDSVDAIKFNMKYAGVRRYSGGSPDDRVNVNLAKRGAATNNAVLQALKNAFAVFNISGANRNSTGELLTNEEGFLSKILSRRGPEEILTEIESESGPVAASTTLNELDSLEDKPRAAMDADKFLERIIERLKDRYAKAQDKLDPDNSNSPTRKRTEVYIKLQELLKQYSNLSFVANKLYEGIEGTINKLETNNEKARNEIREILSIVHPESSDIKILAPAFKKTLSESQMDLFNEMIQGGIDFNQSPAEIMKQIKNSKFSKYTPQKTDDAILMSKFILMARKNPVTIEMLFLRGENPDFKGRFNKVLSIAFQNDRNAGKRALKKYQEIFPEQYDEKRNVGEFARFNKRVNKLLKTIESHKAEYSDLDIEINSARDDIAMWETIRNTLAEEQAVLGKIYDKELSFNGVQWEPTHESEYMVPASPTQELVNVEESTKTLDLSQKVDIASINSDIEKMTAWLENQPLEQRGAIWKTMKRQRDKLIELPADQTQREVSSSWIMRILGDYTTKLDLIGSAQSRKLQTAFRKLSSFLNSYGGENAKRIGREWAIALSGLQKVLKKNGLPLEQSDVLRRFHDSAYHFFDTNRDVLNQNPGEKGRRMLVNLYKSHLRKKEGDALANAIWPEMQKLILATRKASNHVNNIRRELGLSVKDEFGDVSFFRDSIGDSLTTTMRKPSEEVPSLFNMMRQNGWEMGKDELKTRTELEKDFLESPELFLDYIQKHYSQEIMKDFVGPLARKEGEGLLEGYTDKGFKRPIPQSKLREAYENNPNDFMAMLESVAASEGIISPEARAEFFSDSVNAFQKIYRTIKSTQERKTDFDASRNTALPPHIMMDARKTSNWPAEWVSYATFGERNMHQYAKHLSVEAAFGRDMGLLYKDMNRLEKELDDAVNLKKKIDNQLRDEGINTSPRIFRGAYKKAFNELAPKGMSYSHLKKANEKKQILDGMMKNITNWLASESSSPMEYYALNDFIRTLSGFTVQSYGTALIDTISIAEQPFRKLGLGKEAFKQLGRNIYNSLGIGTGSFFQIFNKTIGFHAEKMQLMKELGLDDMTATQDGNFFTRIKDNYDAALVDEFVGENIFTKTLEYVSRAGRAVLGTGAGKAEEGKAAFPALRVATPFTQLAKQSAMANTMSTWTQYQALILQTGKLLESNPQYSEIIKNEGILFDDAVLKKYGLTLKGVLKELGYGRSFLVFDDTRAFMHMNESLQRNGFTLEAVTQDYLQRRNKDPKADPIGDLNLYRALANLTISEVMMDTDLITRPTAMTSSKLGQTFMPLLGWSLAKGNDVRKEFNEPGGVASWKGVRMALKSYLAIMPLQLFYAWLRDEYDEEVVGKKSDVQKGQGFLGAPSLKEIEESPADAFQIMLERQDRVGAFGILGEAATFTAGQFGGGTRDFSVDSRVYALNTFWSLLNTTTKFFRQGGISLEGRDWSSGMDKIIDLNINKGVRKIFPGYTWQSVGRPMAQSLGGAGFLQTAQALNNVTGKMLGKPPAIDTEDYWVNHRIGVQNYIRAAGRTLNLDVKTRAGMRGTPSKTKAIVGQMMLAAIADDFIKFDNARREAIRSAKEEGKAEPEKSVLASYQAYHPLKQAFKTPPTEKEFERILSILDADARKGVRDAVDNINKYTNRMGGNSYEGKKDKTSVKLGKRPTVDRPTRPNYKSASTAFN